MGILGQGIGSGHHKKRPIHLYAHVKRPDRGGIQHIADKYLVTGGKGEDHNAPGKGFAHTGAETVNKMKQSGHKEFRAMIFERDKSKVGKGFAALLY
jgi:hypothetical protein